MRKILLGVAALIAVLATLGLGSSASAATLGTLDTTTYSDGGPWVHALTTDYTCAVGADGKTAINFNILFDGGTGSGVLIPDTNGGGTFVFDGVTGSTYDWHYGGTYDANGVWTTASATANSGSEVYNFGTTGHTAANFGSVVGSFSGIPTCATPEVPATVTDNHGQCVSGAAHAGYKGNALAAIAKSKNMVGAFGSATCKP